jgi:hypothetical protein
MPSSGYTANSFTAGQQPTTTIWNELWANDASFNSGAGFNDGIIIARHLANGSVTPSALATGASKAYVATSEVTSSTTYTDLTTTTDTTTVNIGANGLAIVIVSCSVFTSAAGVQAFMSWAASGASAIAADDSNAFASGYPSVGAGQLAQGSMATLVTGLTPGSTTFKAKYRVTSSNSTWAFRRISVIPL